MLIPSCDRVWNILVATPEWDRMPTPTMDTLAIDSSVATPAAPISLADSSTIFNAFLKSDLGTVKVRSV